MSSVLRSRAQQPAGSSWLKRGSTVAVVATFIATFATLLGAVPASAATFSGIDIVVPNNATTIATGDSMTLHANARFSDGTTQDITDVATWSLTSGANLTLSGTTITGKSVLGNTSQVRVAYKIGTNNQVANYRPRVGAPDLLGLTVDCGSTKIVKGATRACSATAVLTSALRPDVASSATWTSSDPAKLTVGASTGVLTGVDAGTSTISATYTLPGAFTPTDATKSGSASASVKSASSVDITPGTSSSRPVGYGRQLAALVTYTDGSTEDLTSVVTWTSSSPSIASVSAAGLYSGLAEGTATITAKVPDSMAFGGFGGVTDEYYVQVLPAVLQSITVTPATSSKAAGRDQIFIASGHFSDGTDVAPLSGAAWSSSSASATVVDGLAHAAAAGDATITASQGRVLDGVTTTISGTAAFNVRAAEAISLDVTPAEESFAAGEYDDLVAKATLTDGTVATVTNTATWTSSDTELAQVSSSGHVTTFAAGDVTITANYPGEDGTTVSDSSLIHLGAPIVRSVVLDDDAVSAAAGTTKQLAAQSKLSTGIWRATSGVWMSSDESVATVDSSGLVTAKSVGTATITVAEGQGLDMLTFTVTAGELQSLQITPAELGVFPKGTTRDYQVEGTYTDGVRDVTNEVTFDAAGAGSFVNNTLTAENVGTFSVSAALDGKTTYVTITVAPAQLLYVNLYSADSADLAQGETRAYTATGTYTDGTRDITGDVTFTSGAGTFAGNVLTATTVGTYDVTAGLDSVYGTGSVTVVPAKLLSIAVSSVDSGDLAKGLTREYTAEGTYTDGTRDITNDVAFSSPAGSFDQNVLTAENIASTFVEATLDSVVGSTSVNVIAAQLVSIEVSSADSGDLAKGLTRSYSAEGTYTDATTGDVTSEATFASAAGTFAGSVLTATTEGTSDVTATVGSIVGATSVTVIAAQLVSIEVSSTDSGELAKGLTRTYSAEGTFTDGSTDDVTGAASFASGAGTFVGAVLTATTLGTNDVTATVGSIVGTTSVTVGDARLVSVEVSSVDSGDLAKGLTRAYTAEGTYTDGTKLDLTSVADFSSAAGAFAGNILTAQTEGTADVTATADSIVGTTSVTVTAAELVSIAVTSTQSGDLAKGKQRTYLAEGTYTDDSTADITDDVIFASPAGTFAGNVLTAGSLGNHTVTATLGSIVGTTDVNVIAATLESIAVSSVDSGDLAKGLTRAYTAEGTYSDGTTADVTGDATFASAAGTFAGAVLTAKAVGTNDVTATIGSVSGSTSVTVIAAQLVSIAVSSVDSGDLAKGLTRAYTAEGTYTDAGTADVTGDATFASAAGTFAGAVLTASTLGTNDVTATVGSISGSTPVTVIAAQLVSIAVTSASSGDLPKGVNREYTATGTYTDATTADITSTVSFSSVAGTFLGAVLTATTLGTHDVTATVGSISGSTPVTVVAPVISTIAVAPATKSLAKGLTQQYTATATLSDGTTEDITSTAVWSIGTVGKATVSATGLVTAAQVGTTTVLADKGGKQGQADLTVTPAELVSIVVEGATAGDLAKGLTRAYTVTGTYTDATTADLTSTATLASTAGTFAGAVLTAVNVGTHPVSATVGAVTASTSVTVIPAQLVSISVTPGAATVVKGLNKAFSADGTYTDGTRSLLTGSVTWASQDPTVATLVSAGGFKGAGVGTTTITATLGAISGGATLTVTPAQAVSVSLSATSATIKVTDVVTLKLNGLMTDGTTQDLSSATTWTTSAASVATVSGGAVTGVAVGSATITAKYGSFAPLTAAITVNRATPVMTTLNAKRTTSGLTGTIVYSATLKDANGGAMVGKAISFRNGNGDQQCAVVTNATGFATCTVNYTVLVPALGASFSGNFTGDANFAAITKTSVVTN